MPTPEETLRQLDDALGFSHGPSLSADETAQIQVDPTPAERARRALDAYGTDLMRPGQDPAAYDLANPPSPPIPARIAGLAGGPLNEQMPPDAVAPRNGADYLTPVDAIGSEDRTTTRQASAPDQAYAGPEPTTPSADMPASPPGSVAEADRQFAQSARDTADAQSNSAQAKLAAETYHAQQMQTALEDSAEEQQLANHAFERARQANEAKADADTASWITSMEAKAKEEPLPGRWWSNQGHLGQALWGLGLLFSSAYAAITPGARNAALDMVRQNINNDMEEQKARQGREMAVLKLKGEAMRQQQDRAANDIRDDHSMRMTRIQALEKAWMNKATIPGDQDALAAKAASQQFFQELKGKVIEDFRNEKISATQNELNRRHAEVMQAAAQNFQAKQNDLNRAAEESRFTRELQSKYDLAPVSIGTGAGGKVTGPGADMKDLPRVIPRQMGSVLVDQSGKPVNGGNITFRPGDDKQFSAFTAANANANEQYKDLTELQTALRDGRTVSGIATGVMNPQVEHLLKRIAYRTAKQENGNRVSDNDFANAVNESIGFNPDGNTLEKGKFFANYKEIQKLVDKQIADMPGTVTNTLNQYNDANINGQDTKIIWSPPNLSAPEVRPKNSAEEQGVTPKTQPIVGVTDYNNRRALEDQNPARRGYLLPEHDKAAVESVIAGTEGRSPATVHAVAGATLDQLKAKAEALTKQLNPDLWNGEQPLDPAAREAAIQALSRVYTTEDIIDRIENDAATKQQKELNKFKSQAKALRLNGDASAEDLRKMATEMGLTDAEDAVAPIIDEVMKVQPLRRPTFGG